MPPDGSLSTANNNGWLLSVLQYVSPETVDVIYGAMNAGRAFGERIIGSSTDRVITWANAEQVSRRGAYDDFAPPPLSDVNYDYDQRETRREMTGIVYGDFETDMAGRSRLNLIQDKRKSAALSMAKFLNEAALYGLSGQSTYGFLTDPNLPPAITPAVWKDATTPGSGGNIVLWTDKNGYQKFEDVRRTYNQLLQQSGSMIDISQSRNLKKKILIGTSLQNDIIGTTNEYQFDMAKQYDALFGQGMWEIVALPELDDPVRGATLAIIIEEYQGVKTCYCGHQLKYQEGRIETHSTHYSQKVYAQTAGFFGVRPFLIAKMTGLTAPTQP
ncbi:MULTISPECIES: DUF2184 domain-containing protein [unclassified Saccharibacter]|uniref:DUF2184 domain-containing protein n=1 Tax=unclassified Saccharibacter TaxID=2648722 RepID=UPI0013292C18|nr:MULTISPECIES: DUF2184 domain-containing protein [unclassified Saccharibacter]MXV35682.1 hypothetical protein [Saccharibacter sp. EH611]MXV58296.1 hypothetical protein [Saccharibacter sp. EH70]MXV66407.1 hypothetical protein [Saccharibacter sp. EH60]